MITKIGFDVHGVLDTFPAFVAIMNTMIADPNFEVHIITGLSRDHADAEIGHIVDLSNVKYMSIVDYLIENKHTVDWIDGLPYANQVAWDKAKSEYCEHQGIDILFDDSPTYGQHFEDVPTTFCHVQNANRKSFKTR